jgi:hypothetical protein
MGIQIVLLQPTINRRDLRQARIGLLPLPVEQLDGHPGKGADPFQDELLLLGREPARFAPVGARLGLEPLEAGLLEGVIPVFQSAFGH